MVFPYSRQINRPVRYLKYFTWQDIVGMAFCVLFVPNVFGLLTTVFVLSGWFLENLLFRIGRPPGYRRHFFKSLVRPEHFHAGRATVRRMVIRSTPRYV